jgi:hypothetical protein
MSAATYTGNVKIEWDDSVVLVFSFTDGQPRYAGFIHQVTAVQQSQGTQTQISKLVQTIQQGSFQVSADPATWVETVKTGARGTSNPITVVSRIKRFNCKNSIASTVDPPMLPSKQLDENAEVRRMDPQERAAERTPSQSLPPVGRYI